MTEPKKPNRMAKHRLAMLDKGYVRFECWIAPEWKEELNKVLVRLHAKKSHEAGS